jgi:hypothetical protein
MTSTLKMIKESYLSITLKNAMKIQAVLTKVEGSKDLILFYNNCVLYIVFDAKICFHIIAWNFQLVLVMMKCIKHVWDCHLRAIKWKRMGKGRTITEIIGRRFKKNLPQCHSWIANKINWLHSVRVMNNIFNSFSVLSLSILIKSGKWAYCNILLSHSCSVNIILSFLYCKYH